MRIVYLGVALLCTIASCKQNTRRQQIKDTVVTQDYVLQDLQTAITENPDSVRLYDRMIDTLTNRKQFAAAAEWCNKLIGRGADSNYYYWFIKGDIFRRGQLFDSAISCYQTYLQKFPDDEQVLLNLASTFAEAGNANAVDLANKIAARYPTREMRGEAAYVKGVYYNTAKQYKQARQWLDTAIVINYNFAEAHMEKGYSYYDENNFKEALKSFENLTRLNSNYADAWYWLAKCQEALGNKTAAITAYDEAYALDNSIAEAKQALERLQPQAKARP